MNYICIMENKSETHVRVQKNGQEGWLHRTTWKRIGEVSNKEGWILVATQPAEVAVLREKKVQSVQEIHNQEENVIVENKPFVPEGEIKQLKRGRPKKNEN